MGVVHSLQQRRAKNFPACNRKYAAKRTFNLEFYS